MKIHVNNNELSAMNTYHKGSPFSPDFYNRSVGYVIEGVKFSHDRESACAYLQKVGCMEPEEANSYLERLVNAFESRKATATAMKV